MEAAIGSRSGLAAAPAAGGRRGYVDIFRGLLIAHMALDHASLIFNAGRGGEELAAAAPAPLADLWQFLTRFTGVPVAPAFFFMAGFMAALTGAGRAGRGVPEHEITRRLVVRGLVLIGVDALVMGLPRAAMGFYSFAVLSSIGAALIVLAFARHLPTRVLLPAALAVLALHPLLDVSLLPLPLRAILYEPVREGAFRSLYPLLPWCAIVVAGFVVGRDALRRNAYRCPAGEWAILRFTCVDRGKTMHAYWPSACPRCPLKPQCTPAAYRRIKRWEHEAVLDVVQERLDAAPEAATLRRQTVEHVFGTLKAWMGSSHFLMKRLPNVRTEMSLQVLAYNIKRAVKLLGVPRLISAMSA